jgi:hypothetical protein
MFVEGHIKDVAFVDLDKRGRRDPGREINRIDVPEAATDRQKMRPSTCAVQSARTDFVASLQWRDSDGVARNFNLLNGLRDGNFRHFAVSESTQSNPQQLWV